MEEHEVADLVRADVKRAGGVRALAREWRISPVTISDVLNGRRGPGPKILDHFNLRRVVTVTYQSTIREKGK